MNCILSKDLPESTLFISEEDVPNRQYLQYRFAGFLFCQECKLKISLSGYAHDFDRDRRAVNSEYFDHAGKAYYPIFFNPPLKIFRVGESCPKEIKLQLDHAFSLYWNDKSSCANKIRIVIELLLNFQNVPKSKKSSLDSRIKQLEVDNSERENIKSFLEASKWIGNVGSHYDVHQVTKLDLLNGFEFLEYILNHIYVDEDLKLKRMIATSKEINKNKGIQTKL